MRVFNLKSFYSYLSNNMINNSNNVYKLSKNTKNFGAKHIKKLKVFVKDLNCDEFISNINQNENMGLLLNIFKFVFIYLYIYLFLDFGKIPKHLFLSNRDLYNIKKLGLDPLRLSP